MDVVSNTALPLSLSRGHHNHLVSQDAKVQMRRYRCEGTLGQMRRYRCEGTLGQMRRYSSEVSSIAAHTPAALRSADVASNDGALSCLSGNLCIHPTGTSIQQEAPTKLIPAHLPVQA
jgi:hypothetical protein